MFILLDEVIMKLNAIGNCDCIEDGERKICACAKNDAEVKATVKSVKY